MWVPLGRGISLAVLAALCMLFVAPSLFSQTCPELHGLRTRFLDHSTFNQAVASEQAAQRAIQGAAAACLPYIEAHIWVSHARSADFGWNMADRLMRFKKGMSVLDSLVLAHPEDDVLKALRLSVSGTAPRFLGADTFWEEDAAATKRVLNTRFWAESPKFQEWMETLASDIQAKQSGEAP
ncbi:MAG: hypothetical protein ISP55_03485 [Flavobacteriales bacterium]|nr:hypothetical protein [Flavobacteriales bacterium]